MSDKLVRCLWVGPPSDLDPVYTGRAVTLVPHETVIDMPESVADAHPYLKPLKRQTARADDPFRVADPAAAPSTEEPT